MLLFLAIFLQYLGTAIFAFLILAFFLCLLYISLNLYRKFALASLLLSLALPLIALSSVFYIGRTNFLVYPLAGVLCTLLAIFIHTQFELFAPDDDVTSIYLALRFKMLGLFGVLCGSLLISAVYFPFLAFLPSLKTGVIDVLAALIAVCISLVLLGWFMVKTEEKR